MEFKWQNLRDRRDFLLKNTDFTQLIDFQDSLTDSDKIAWKQYRQTLRDMPDQISEPDDVVWPTRPDEA